jgi:hypothetical protein
MTKEYKMTKKLQETLNDSFKRYFQTLENADQAALMVELTNIMSHSDATFTKRLLEGKIGEDFVNTIFKPETFVERGNIVVKLEQEEQDDVLLEIKTDIKSSETGNIYIEYEQNTNISGLQTTKADLWCTVFVDDNKKAIATIIVTTERLKEVLRENNCKHTSKAKTSEGSATKGYLLPVTTLLNIKTNEETN